MCLHKVQAFISIYIFLSHIISIWICSLVGGYHHGYAAAAPAVVGGYGAHAVAAAPVIGGYGVSKVVTPYAAAAPAVYGGYGAHGMLSFLLY